MANLISAKVVKIDPENQVTAEGIVVKCKFSGSVTVMNRTSYYYKVLIGVEGLLKPLVLKVKEKVEGYSSDFEDARRAFGKNKPVEVGEKVLVTYDRLKPKKCNIAE